MGDTFAAINNVSELATLSALASVRFAMAFLLLPILAQDTVPQLVRGAVFLAFGVVTLAMLPPFLLRSLAASSPFVQGVLPQQNLIGVLGVQAGILLTKLFRLRQQRLATLLLLMLIDLVGVLGLRSFF